MSTGKTHHSSNLVKALILTILLLGIVFRFAHIDKKNYWNDEVYTSLRVAGYTYEQVEQAVVTNQPIGIDDLQRYQHSPTERGLYDVMRSLLKEDAHIAPLYFVMTRLWTDIWGLTPLQTRMVAVMISLLALPSMYWLSYELFQSSAIAWIATLLIAVSPLHVLYAQEARNYSLFAVSVLISSAALLRALRIPTPFAWIGYAAAVAIALYSHMLSILVLLGHGLYVGLVHWWRQVNRYQGYTLAMLCSFACFLPWILASDAIEEPRYVSTPMPLLTLVKRSLFNITVNFFDAQIFNRGQIFDAKFGDDSIQLDILEPSFYVFTIFVLLSIYSLYFLIQNSLKHIHIFVIILIATNILPLLLPDLLTNGQRFTITRYLIPALLGVQLAIAYTLGFKLLNSKASFGGKRIPEIGLIFLVFCGISSCLVSMKAETWWIKYSSYHDPRIAQIINKAASPIIVSGDVTRMISLSYLLEPKVQIILASSETFPDIPDDVDNVFLYWPEERFTDYLEQYYSDNKLEHQLGQLWRLDI
ncbi:MAG: glycosyltransferase family 39 protein [Cyanobacteria bacterium P01_F01_bin.86]